MDELSITDKSKTRKQKARKFIEDDDDVPDLQSDDDDSDDEETTSSKKQYWRNTHTAAAQQSLSAQATASTTADNSHNSAPQSGNKRPIQKAETITKSVLSIGQTCGRPHFMEWRLHGSTCEIINHNMGRAFTLDTQGNNLYPIPPSYFYKDDITPASSAERPPALMR